LNLLSLNIAITEKNYKQLFDLDGVLEFGTQIFSLKIVYHGLPELSSTQNQPSLQSRCKVEPIELGSAHEWSGA